ncbi:MAG TPA: catalase [Bacillota bacterium]|nr:catalase [Bacillota bacterium]
MDKTQKDFEKGQQKLDKAKQLENFTVNNSGKGLTTNQGMKLSHTDDSLKAGERGPTLMEDFHFREKLTHFDNERIPERVVHARGFGAHGYFQVYESMAEHTKAKFLQNPDVKTPVFVRFSTVVGSKGSADTVRDVRGFATKFYTEDGNYDLVANNMPIFFIQDAIKFPDVVHAIKPEQHNEIPQATAAHDTFWDFVVNTPEIPHMILWLMSDRAIPRSFRMMEGFGVNTFRFINDKGKATFVKLFWKPLLGVHSLVWDEAQKLSGSDPDFHRRDLWNAINMGEYPEYELGVQMIDESEEFMFDFDILDPTKLWPEEQVPVQRIGRMVLDRNVDNFFAETEQVAFHPGHVVPGIDFTNDPLLQGRLFSYLDTQLVRLGGPNFHEIPINRPIAPVHNNQREGLHRMTINKGAVAYSPNTLQANTPEPVAEEEGGYVHHTERVDGSKIRKRSESFKDHYSQARLFWNSMSSIEKQHIIEAFHFEVGSVLDKQTKQRVVDMFSNVDGDLAEKIATGIGAAPPAEKFLMDTSASSPALSQLNTPKSAKSRKVAILIENGFNHTELSQVMTLLKSGGVNTEVISSNIGIVTSAEGKELEAMRNYITGSSVKYDAVYIPGGQKSVDAMINQSDSLYFVNETFKHVKTLAASNEGVDLLAASTIKGVALAGPDTESDLLTELGVVTIRNATDMTLFVQEFIKNISEHRHWARENKKNMTPA